MGRQKRAYLIVTIEELRELFPAISEESRITSPEDDSYNCIAWAAEDTSLKWWPLDLPTTGAYWPSEVAPEDSVDGFVAGFGVLGYERCAGGGLEPGFQKLVLYVDANGNPSHMARQLPSGAWASKLGDLEDIEHPTPEDLCGKEYGRVECFLRRAV